MTHYSHDDLLALAPSYALGATSAEEMRAVEEAMASSPALAAEVRAHGAVVADLLTLQPSMTPSGDVRRRLLDGVAPQHLAPLMPARKYARYVAAAAIVVAAVLGLEVVRMQRRIAEDARQLAQRDATISSFLGAEKDLRIVHLIASDSLDGPGIQLFWDARHRVGLMHAFRLPPAPAGESYQLWAVIDSTPVSVRVFDSSPSGHAIVEGIPLPSSTKGLSRMMLTVEPRGGSRAPTSVPLLGGNLSSN